METDPTFEKNQNKLIEKDKKRLQKTKSLNRRLRFNIKIQKEKLALNIYKQEVAETIEKINGMTDEEFYTYLLESNKNAKKRIAITVSTAGASVILFALPGDVFTVPIAIKIGNDARRKVKGTYKIRPARVQMDKEEVVHVYNRI